jgi:nitrogenase molybdenum-iron protein beta chain
MSNITENPRGGCVLSGISASLAAIKGFCPVFHSGPGCCMQTSAAVAAPVELSGVSIPCSNMLEREVVFGGIQKLKSTVQGAIDVIDADTYVILNGCTSGIIGDDVESVAQEFRNNGKNVYAIDTPGFMGDTNLGYEILWNNLIDQVVEPASRDDRLVNVFGIIPGLDPFWRGNLEEISRILKKLGLKVNTFYRDGQSVENVRKSSAAALNIIINPWIFKGPAEKYEEKFGVPYLRIAGLPIGATDTAAFIKAVAQKLGIDSETTQRVIDEEEEYLYSYLEHGIGILGWKRTAVVGDANSAVGLTRYLANDYSLIPRVVIISEPIFRQEDKDRITEQLSMLEYANAPDIYFISDQFEINKIIRQYDDVTLFLGSANDREEASQLDTMFYEVTFPITSRFIFNKAIAGYKGSLTLIEDLFSNL